MHVSLWTGPAIVLLSLGLYGGQKFFVFKRIQAIQGRRAVLRIGWWVDKHPEEDVKDSPEARAIVERIIKRSKDAFLLGPGIRLPWEGRDLGEWQSFLE